VVSAGVLGDPNPHEKRAIVERHGAIADGRLVGRLMESFGVFVAAPAGGADAAGNHERRSVDNPLVCGGIGDSGRAAEDRRAVDLDTVASEDGDDSDAFVEERDRSFVLDQSALKDEGESGEPSADTARIPFICNSSRASATDREPLNRYPRLSSNFKPG